MYFLKSFKMKKLQITAILLFNLVISASGADAKNQIQVSFYEIGDSIVNYDTSFKNLFHNWTTDKLTNAADYKLLNYTFLETINDSTVLDLYVRLMTSNKMFGLSSKKSESTSMNGVTENKYTVEPNLFSVDSLFTVKNQRLRKLYEDRKFLLEILRITSDDFCMSEVKSGQVVIKKSPESMNDEEYKAYIVEGSKAERAMAQLYFQKLVNIGDAVYVVNFRYKGKLYSDYVVCDAKTKKVKVDGYFKGVCLWVDVE